MLIYDNKKKRKALQKYQSLIQKCDLGEGERYFKIFEWPN